MEKVYRITEDMTHCYVCGLASVEMHHIFFGSANRKVSDKFGLVVPLCNMHHTGSEGVHRIRKLDLLIKKRAQRLCEQDMTREEFVSLFGKSWI